MIGQWVCFQSCSEPGCTTWHDKQLRNRNLMTAEMQPKALTSCHTSWHRPKHTHTTAYSHKITHTRYQGCMHTCATHLYHCWTCSAAASLRHATQTSHLRTPAWITVAASVCRSSAARATSAEFFFLGPWGEVPDSAPPPTPSRAEPEGLTPLTTHRTLGIPGQPWSPDYQIRGGGGGNFGGGA